MKLIVHYTPDDKARAVSDGLFRTQANQYVSAYLQERRWDPSAPDYVVCTSTLHVLEHIRKVANERNISPQHLEFRWNGAALSDKMNSLLENK